jgi:hypothetical protein
MAKRSWRDTMRVHEACERFPPMSADELRELGEDIKKNGVRYPVAVWTDPNSGEELLLDGRNRLDAMELVGLDVFNGSDGDLAYETVEGDPYSLALSFNLHRRHLTDEQRRDAIIDHIARAPEKSDRQIGKEIGVDHKTISRARAKGEDVGRIPHVETRTDAKGRQQPAHKAEPRRRTAAEREAALAVAGRVASSMSGSKDPAVQAAADRAEARSEQTRRRQQAASGNGNGKPPSRFAPDVEMAPHAERGADLYETPACAVRALLEVEPLSGTIWECACGPGSIVGELRAAGHCVFATDIEDYGCPYSVGGVDFLKQIEPPKGDTDATIILTNPPYRLANRFVRHALALAPNVVMLLPLRFLESTGRADILDGGQLARVYVFRNRLPMMHRAGWDGRKIATGKVAYAWFIWDREHHGPATVHRISWREHPLFRADNLENLRGAARRREAIDL